MSNEYTRSVLDKVYERELKAMHDLAFPPITYDRPKFKQEYKGESMKCDRTTEVDKYKEIDAMRRLKVRSENITSLADVIIDAARQIKVDRSIGDKSKASMHKALLKVLTQAFDEM